ncbi:BppU family phage baseplate upper protein [Bacillus cereus]|uniref:BppU N-terminal domain-containing protein n=1 Tax=Bacillus cereus TaxID=1396 RepID=A0A1S9UV81_BACCE|nr:BppU family phage baseplate upper protein [Bacillus cereus]OOR26147.1 hypothetical protein BW892_12650 [Bacillus cereus]
MTFKTAEITVDLMENVNTKEIDFSQGDQNSAKLFLNLTNRWEELDLSGATAVRVTFEKPDGTTVFQKDCQPINAMKGKYQIILNTQTLASAGTVIAQVLITEIGRQLESKPFIFTVKRSLSSDEVVESKNEYTIIQKAIEVGEKLEGVDIDGIIAAGAKADGAVKRTGDTMTGNLTVPRLYAGSSPDKQANVGTGNADVYLSNTLSKKYLQLKDDGALLYNNVPVALADTAQMQKITLDNGGATISISDTSKNILDEIKTKGPGMNTIYCAGGVQGQTPNNKSWRGVSFLNSVSYGLVWAKDFHNKFFTNYMDNGNWLGWVEHSDANLTQNIKITQDNGDSIIQARNNTEDILKLVSDAGRGFRTIYAAGSALNTPTTRVFRGFANMQGINYGYIIGVDTDNRMWTNFINGSTWSGWKCVNGSDKDGRANLTLTADATNINAGFPPTAIRRGNTVTFRMHIKRNLGSTGTLVTTLPVGMRPIDSLVYYVPSLDGTTVSVHVASNGDVNVYTADKDIKFSTTYVVD